MCRRLRHAWMLAVLVSMSCGTPQRRALPTPFPLTAGATPIPARGMGFGLELGDGLRGQELRRTEIVAWGIAVGFADAVSASLNGYDETRNDGESGTFWRMKVRLASPFGSKSRLGLHFATAWTERRSGDVQDEKLRVFDLAVPVEFLLTKPGTPGGVSAFVAPRVVIEDYEDLLRPSESVNVAIAGMLGVLHFRRGIFHLFGEASVVYVPENQFMGQTFAGQVMVVPALGVIIHTGRSYRWVRE